jgi:regulator of PEP synthase PpsR (kinase-PPPase family)
MELTGVSQPTIPPVYIVSGGVGSSGEQLVLTVLAQFPDFLVPVITVGNIRQVEQIGEVVTRAAKTGGTIVHTLVEDHLRNTLVQEALDQGVVAIDLMGPLLSRLAETLNEQPLGQPGLYRQLNLVYFERVAAIDFALAYDDGRNSQGWPLAEIVLVGVSRVGKTPLSMYLSVLGWKVANIPLISGMSPKPELFRLDCRRVIGLHLDPDQLLIHRQQRQRQLGAPGPSTYADPATIMEEVKAARRVFKQGGFSVVDVTHKPIETSADEIIRLITRQLQV